MPFVLRKHLLACHDECDITFPGLLQRSTAFRPALLRAAPVHSNGRRIRHAPLLTGINLPDKGGATWNGTDLAEADPVSVRRHTGLVPQIFAQRPLRVRENLTLGRQ